MDLFEHSYYRLNKFLMNVIGQWPNQKTPVKFCCRVTVFYFYVSEILCRMRTIYNHHDNSDMIRDCTIEMFIQIGGITLFIGFMLNSQTTLQLLNRIRMDWQVWAGEREVNILHEYTELGKNLNVAFAVVMYSVGSFIMIQPVIEKIMDILLKNGTEPGKFILMVDYYHVDEQKYYFYVVTYFNVASLVIGAPVLTNYVMLISYTQHGSGIFAALRHIHKVSTETLRQRLQDMGNNGTSVEKGKPLYLLDDRDIVEIAWCIDRHNDAIEYVNLMEAAFRWNFFITTGLGIILANGLGLLILTQPTNLQLLMTSLGIVGLMGLCLFIECVSSQMLIDHSISIRVYIHNSQWYNLSPKAQKLLQYMIMRSNSPSQLTAGNMLIMSIRSIWLIFKSTVSYFAFVRSTQGV